MLRTSVDSFSGLPASRAVVKLQASLVCSMCAGGQDYFVAIVKQHELHRQRIGLFSVNFIHDVS